MAEPGGLEGGDVQANPHVMGPLRVGKPFRGDNPLRPGGREKPLSDEGGVPVPETDTGGRV